MMSLSRIIEAISLHGLRSLGRLSNLCACSMLRPACEGVRAGRGGGQAGRVTLQALAIAAAGGAALCGALICGADGALAAMGADPSTGPLHDYACQYLVIRSHAPLPPHLLLLEHRKRVRRASGAFNRDCDF